jgi:NAD(P)-dependent dehydrogenase (short-subunit alcohol dehydrogenase family)
VDGARLVLSDVDAGRLEELAASLPMESAVLVGDISEEALSERLVALAVKRFGGLDIAINNAGIAQSFVRLPQVPSDEARRIIDVDLMGVFYAMKYQLPQMERQYRQAGKGGAIVNIASVAAFDGQIGQAAYSASKAGVAGMTLPIARDLASKGIRVVTIAPGPSDTPMLGPMRDDIRESLTSQIPFPKRLGRAEDFAALVKHIIENEYLNGEVIRLDGALRMGPR